MTVLIQAPHFTDGWSKVLKVPCPVKLSQAKPRGEEPKLPALLQGPCQVLELPQNGRCGEFHRRRSPKPGDHLRGELDRAPLPVQTRKVWEYPFRPLATNLPSPAKRKLDPTSLLSTVCHELFVFQIACTHWMCGGEEWVGGVNSSKHGVLCPSSCSSPLKNTCLMNSRSIAAKL